MKECVWLFPRAFLERAIPACLTISSRQIMDSISRSTLISDDGDVALDNQLVDTVQKGEEAEPIMLKNGCASCTISNGFFGSCQSYFRKGRGKGIYPWLFHCWKYTPRRCNPICETISNATLRLEVYVDPVPTIVDSIASTDAQYDSETAVKQIQSADTVFLSKTDQADQFRLGNYIQSILSIRPNARMLRSQRGYAPIAALLDLGVSMSLVL